ncbi:SET domain protein [Teladorsagia circumcincta]|uniref:SET domain protein n=1 Tax=Teladorsagia circumcincta TaxID=45464 RepID=A0A2G9U3W1_TELCI|nr:SET domain protein [Teladorsagia circumcincta]
MYGAAGATFTEPAAPYNYGTPSGSIVGRTSNGQPISTLTPTNNSGKGPQPLLVQGVYPQGGPIVVQGDTPKVLVPAKVQVRLQQSGDASVAISPTAIPSSTLPMATSTMGWSQAAPMKTAFASSGHNIMTSPCNTQVLVPAKVQVRLQQSGDASVAISPTALPSSTLPMATSTMGWSQAAPMKTAFASSGHNIMSSPCNTQMQLEGCDSVCEERCDNDEDFADMPRLLPVDQEDAQCSNSCLSVREDVASSHGSECETAPTPSISITPSMDSKDIVEQLLMLDPEKANAIANLIKRRQNSKRRSSSKQLASLLEATVVDMQGLHIGLRERHDRRHSKERKNLFTVNWEQVRKRRRKEDDRKRVAERSERKKEVVSKSKDRDHPKRELREKSNDAEISRVEANVERRSRKRRNDSVEKEKEKEEPRTRSAHSTIAKRHGCCEAPCPSKREKEYEEIPRSMGVGPLPEWDSPVLSCGCTRGACTSDSECVNRALCVQCPLACAASLCANKKFWKDDAVKSLVVSGAKTRKILRTKQARRAGDFLCEFAGEVIRYGDAKQRWETYSKTETTPVILCLTSRLFVDATIRGNVSRYVRQSCRPNARLEVWFGRFVWATCITSGRVADSSQRNRIQFYNSSHFRALRGRYLCEVGVSGKSEKEEKPKRDRRREARFVNRDTNLEYIDSIFRVGSYDPDEVWPLGKANEKDDAVRCVCGSLEEDGEMTQCDTCNFWLHSECLDTRDVDQETALTNNRSIQVRLNETVHVQRAIRDDHKKILKKLMDVNEKRKKNDVAGEEKFDEIPLAAQDRLPPETFHRKEEDVYLCEYQIDRNQRSFEKIPSKNRYPINTQPYVFRKFDEPITIKRDFTMMDNLSAVVEKLKSPSKTVESKVQTGEEKKRRRPRKLCRTTKPSNE